MTTQTTSLIAALTDALTDRAATPHSPAIIVNAETGEYRYGSALNMGADESVAFDCGNGALAPWLSDDAADITPAAEALAEEIENG